MSITPDTPRESAHITLCQIHSADKSDTSVNNRNLTVITIVHLTGKQWKTNLQKATHFHARLTHLIIKTVGNMPASHIIINNTYLYPLSCLIYQYISHHTPDGIILKNIELHVDMFRSLLQLAQ